jgi:hypothetical protein
LTLHTKLSYIKSGIRIAGYCFLCVFGEPLLTIAAGFLIVAETIGIVEELPGSYIGTDTSPTETK